MVAVPGNPPRFIRPSALGPQEISVAIAGGCSAGGLDDMKVIAEILTKNKVHLNKPYRIIKLNRKIGV